jgi:hypothetical protein
MKHSYRANFVSTCLLLVIAGLVCGAPVSGQVQSDTAFGFNSFSSGYGNYDTVFGAWALWQIQPGGDGNTAIGYTSMYWNTTGIGNTATGNQSLNQNRTGYWNTATGSNALISNTTGNNNTASGIDALACNFNGSWNTASGAFALGGGTFNFAEPFPVCAAGHAYYASGNTATGAQALFTDTTGNNNTASGFGALYSNTTAAENTATGYNALYANTTGGDNTASGAASLYSNTTGYQNTASGYGALYSNTVGNHNTVAGFEALYSNTNGNSNTADGDFALYYNTTGYHNTASGSNSLFSNTTGTSNVAVGLEALYSNTTGSNNIAVGTSAGFGVTQGSNNIDIGSEGSAGDSGVVRIGAAGLQSATYIAGIENSKVTGGAVYVTASGQLGVLASSERYKTAIAPMGADSEKLQELRPVRFHLKTDPKGAVQYGLIAEEVAKVYPELVIRNGSGQIEGVRYDELAPMLLNEMQKQQRINAAQIERNNAQTARIASLERQLADIQAALGRLEPKDQVVARR